MPRYLASIVPSTEKNHLSYPVAKNDIVVTKHDTFRSSEPEAVALENDFHFCLFI